MEAIKPESGMAKGTEILYFQDAEVRKYKNDQTSFASSGPLKVLFFKDYMRFVLEVNDWRYPLLRRLPVTSQGQGTYVFPALNGFSYELKIGNVGNNAGVQNFETILSHTSNYGGKGQEPTTMKREASPEDKLVRRVKKATEEHGPLTTISETLKSAGQSVKNKVASLQTGSKNLMSRRKALDLKTIKNKSWKKSARSTFKKDFFTSSEKLSHDFLEGRKNNPFLTGVKDFDDLRKATHLPSAYVYREDIEEAILDNKDLASQGGYTQGPEQKKGGLLDNLKQGLSNIKESFTGILHGQNVPPGEGRVEDRGREQRNVTGQGQTNPKLAGYEGMTHLSG